MNLDYLGLLIQVNTIEKKKKKPAATLSCCYLPTELDGIQAEQKEENFPSENVGVLEETSEVFHETL